MYNKYVEVTDYQNKYESRTTNTYSQEYKEFKKNDLLKLLENSTAENNEKISVLKDKKYDLIYEVKTLLMQVGEIDLEIEHIGYSEGIKKKVAFINEKEKELIETGRMNKYTTSVDGSSTVTETIQNTVYHMYFRIYEYTHYDRNLGKSVPYRYQVSYTLSFNSWFKENSRTTIQSVEKMFHVSEKDAMYKYIEGRKKAYSKYFKENRPAIPRSKVDLITNHGILIDGFTIDEGA